MMNKLLAVVLALTAVAYASAPGYALQVGRQSFEKIDFSDSRETRAEMELAAISLQDPGITPDSPLYFIKRIGESIRLIFSDEAGRQGIRLEIANARLAEAKRMVEENKPDYAKKAADEFEAGIGGINISYPEAAKNSAAVKSVIDSMLDRPMPEVAAVLNASIVKIHEKRATSGKAETPEAARKGSKGVFCIQVVARARNPSTGEAREFPTPCDIPEGWVTVGSPETSELPEIPEHDGDSGPLRIPIGINP